MDYSNIDFNKSIEKERIVFNEFPFWDTFWDMILLIFTIGFFPVILLMVIINNNYSFWLIFLFIVSLIFFGLIIYSYFNTLKLKKLNVKSTNADSIKTIFEKWDWEFMDEDKRTLFFYKDWKWTSTNYGRQFTILIYNRKIYYNCLTFARHRMKSPFHWFSSRKIEKSFEEEFLKLNDRIKKTQ